TVPRPVQVSLEARPTPTPDSTQATPPTSAAPIGTPSGSKAAPPAPRAISLDIDEEPIEPRGSKQTVVLVAFFAVLLLGSGALVYALRPDVFHRLVGDEPVAADRSGEVATARADEARVPAPARYGDLLIRVPDRAQVLMRVGRGPAVATNLPVGLAHEFVAIADGRVPTRAIVPPDASWDPTPEGPRYELAMQTGEAEVPFEAIELGPTRLPSEAGVNQNRLGAVRVVTTPPGAEVFLLIGFGPEARVRDLRADQTYELVIWREGFAPKRVLVRPDDFLRGEEGKRAEVDVELEPRRARRR
ncbi:MAG: hypothetical protein H5U40_17220, partial [Polyangiaceae bacterium]|nr:hypothetical protein [Polyangiaceae bacterium]